MIDTFNKQTFEKYLDKNYGSFTSLGLVKGEETYSLYLDGQSSVTIRSSIKDNGISASTGKDSIRVWLVKNNDKPLGSKISKVYRQPNWQDRLTKNINQLIIWRTLAGDCKKCGKAKGIFRVKKEGKNKGRMFANCSVNSHNGFVWLDEPIKKSDIYFSGESYDTNSGQGNIPHMQAKQSDDNTVQSDNNEAQVSTTSETVLSPDLQEMPEKVETVSTEEIKANKSQLEAINKPSNRDTRVLAGPGSGKTFVITHRYNHLVNDGVNPENILVVTYSKDMASEMANRISKVCPSANSEQISTIHALCYRLLSRWYSDSKYYKWGVPKDWKIKNTLEEIISVVWKGKEKPNVKEVYDYICTSKNLGLSTDDSYTWFADTLGHEYDTWLYEIRSKFDAWLNHNRFMTFSDMLFLVEQRLRSDEGWRIMLQERFSQVIVDEAQDTNAQAMRILITISLKPGKNDVYA